MPQPGDRDIISHAENMTASEKRSLVYLTSSKISKEQTTLQSETHRLDFEYADSSIL